MLEIALHRSPVEPADDGPEQSTEGKPQDNLGVLGGLSDDGMFGDHLQTSERETQTNDLGGSRCETVWSWS